MGLMLIIITMTMVMGKVMRKSIGDCDDDDNYNDDDGDGDGENRELRQEGTLQRGRQPGARLVPAKVVLAPPSTVVTRRVPENGGFQLRRGENANENVLLIPLNPNFSKLLTVYDKCFFPKKSVFFNASAIILSLIFTD